MSLALWPSPKQAIVNRPCYALLISKDISPLPLDVSPAQELPRESTRNRNRMSRQHGDFSQQGLRLVEDTQLSQHRAPVVVDFFPGKTIIGAERIHAAKRELDSSP